MSGGEGTHAVPNYPDPMLHNVNMAPMPGDRVAAAEEPVAAEEPEEKTPAKKK